MFEVIPRDLASYSECISANSKSFLACPRLHWLLANKRAVSSCPFVFWNFRTKKQCPYVLLPLSQIKLSKIACYCIWREFRSPGPGTIIYRLDFESDHVNIDRVMTFHEKEILKSVQSRSSVQRW